MLAQLNYFSFCYWLDKKSSANTTAYCARWKIASFSCSIRLDSIEKRHVTDSSECFGIVKNTSILCFGDADLNINCSAVNGIETVIDSVHRVDTFYRPWPFYILLELKLRWFQDKHGSQCRCTFIELFRLVTLKRFACCVRDLPHDTVWKHRSNLLNAGGVSKRWSLTSICRVSKENQ